VSGAETGAGPDRVTCRIDGVDVHAFQVPTDGPDGKEQDGTLEWDSTTMVLVQVHAGGRTGLGYTYGDVSVASFVDSVLAPLINGQSATAPPALWQLMGRRIRNAGRPGVGAMAVSAVDVALWDLKARLLGLPLVRLLPAYHDRVPVYGSGGFTNYPLDRLADQLTGWVEQGIPRVKLKTSRHPEDDPRRLAADAQAVFTGGGNSFRLLRALHTTGLVEALRDRVAAGAPYMGSSAGTNMACPTLRTTNDMPIVQPPSFEALALVPFQINPHYLDPAPGSAHMGETREERLTQFLEENAVPVLGLREGTWLVREDDRLELAGVAAGARLFRRGAAPEEYGPGTDLSELLTAPARFDVGPATT